MSRKIRSTFTIVIQRNGGSYFPVYRKNILTITDLESHHIQQLI